MTPRTARVVLALGLAAVLPSQAADMSIQVTSRRLPGDDRSPSITVLDATVLHERGATRLEELLATVPGVQANAGEPGRSLPVVRGIGTATSGELLGTQQATTGLHVDDVALTSPFGFVGTPDLTGFSLSRLEVLRGPQGTLYGSSSLGGALRYVLGQPAPGRAATQVAAGVAAPSGGGLGTMAQVLHDQPLADDTAALRVEAFRRSEPGFVDNLGTGVARANRVLRQGVRVALRSWTAGGSVLQASVLQQHQHADDTDAVSPDPQQLSIRTPTASTRSTRFSLARLQADVPLSPQRVLTAVTGWHEQLLRHQLDFTRSSGALGQAFGPLLGLGPLPVLPQVQSATLQPQRGRSLSQELRVTSGADSGPRFVAGVFVQDSRYDSDTRSIAEGGQALWGRAGFLLPGDELGSLRVHGHAREAALFGDLQLPGPADTVLSLGGRAFRTAVDYDARLAVLTRTTVAAPSTHEDGFTPRLSLQLPLGAHRLHATVSEGYRFGGINFNPPALTPYRSDRLRNHELGLQLRPGRALQLDLTAFWIDWRDAQVSALVAGAVPVIGVANVGRARSRGLEAAWTWRSPQGLEVAGALAGTDARTRAPFVTDEGRRVPAGAQLPGTPRWQSRLQLGRRFATDSGWQGQATLGHSWTGARVFDIEGRAAASGHGALDTRLAFSRGPWTLALQVDNLANGRGVTGARVIDRPGVARYTDWFVMPPRRLILNLGHDV